MGKLEGKVALVTGASRGIGCAIARALFDEGAHTYLVSRRRKVVQKLAAAWNKSGIRAEGLSADITREREVNELIVRVKKRSGRLDILINNAGVLTYKPFRKTTFEDWQSNIGSNLTGIFLCTRASLPLMKRRRDAHIVNIISVAGIEAYENCSAYCASKFGALGLSRVLAEELRPLGIRVTAILPGPVRTKMIQKLPFTVEKDQILEPEDVARAVIEALTQRSRASLEEVVLRPTRGFPS